MAKSQSQLEQPQLAARYGEIKTLIKTAGAKAWQAEHTTYSHVKDGMHQLSRKSQRAIFRLRTGHGSFRAHLFKLGKASSTMCTCGIEEQTIAHILQDCPVFLSSRGYVWPTPSTIDDKF